MSDALKPRDAKDVEAAVQWALAEGKTLEVIGQGSKRGIGRAAQWDLSLDLSDLSGVTLYEPEELILSAKAGTPISEIETLLAANNQELAFEPMDYGPVFGAAPNPDGTSRGTIGGTLAANLSGPRRIKAGAARDHFLGVTAVSGRGETFKSGGRVVKNVTGYDLCKLLAGSYGTLAVMTDVTVKVLPRAETERPCWARARRCGCDPRHERRDEFVERCFRRCTFSGASIGEHPGGVRPADHCAAARRRLAVGRASPPRARSVAEAARRDRGAGGSCVARCLAGDPECRAVHRRRPRALAHLGRAVARVMRSRRDRGGLRYFYDWAGGLIWAALPAEGDGGAAHVRAALKGGHATLVRAPAAIRAAVPVFEPQDAALAALTKRVKESFDPKGVLGPGRMYAGV